MGVDPWELALGSLVHGCGSLGACSGTRAIQISRGRGAADPWELAPGSSPLGRVFSKKKAHICRDPGQLPLRAPRSHAPWELAPGRSLHWRRSLGACSGTRANHISRGRGAADPWELAPGSSLLGCVFSLKKLTSAGIRASWLFLARGAAIPKSSLLGACCMGVDPWELALESEPTTSPGAEEQQIRRSSLLGARFSGVSSL